MDVPSLVISRLRSREKLVVLDVELGHSDQRRKKSNGCVDYTERSNMGIFACLLHNQKAENEHR